MKTVFTIFTLLILGGKCFATTWTTISPGSIYTLSNWSNGSSSPTTFSTPGDTWNVTMAMTMSSGMPWTVGTASAAPVTVNIVSGGDITGGAGGFMATLNIYGNMNVADDLTFNGGGVQVFMNVYGNYSQTAGLVEASGGGAILVYNINGNFSMSGGSIMSQGGAAVDTFNIKGNFSMSGPSSLQCVGGSAAGYVYLSRPTTAGIMMIDNTSTGSWSSNSVRIVSNCTAQLAGNFGFTSPNTLTVDGKLICPAPHQVNGVGKFDLSPMASLIVGHATGINGAITCSSTRVFSTNANYGFNGTVAQVTGTDMPATLVAPDTISIDNPMGVTLSQTTATTGKLVFTNGVLHTGAYTITVPGAAASVSGSGLTNYVEGTLIKPAAGLSSIKFEVGDTSYAPMTLTFDAPATGGSIALKVNNGLHPNVATSGITTSYITTHYWNITNMGVTGSATADLTATYNLSTIVSGSNSFFHVQHYNGSSWWGSAITCTNTSSPYTSASASGFALSGLGGDYIFGRPNIPSLGVSAVSNQSTLKLYPNPNKGSFTVNVLTENTETADVVITDAVGKVVKEFTLPTNNATGITMNNVPGLYFVNVKISSGSYTERLLIE